MSMISQTLTPESLGVISSRMAMHPVGLAVDFDTQKLAAQFHDSRQVINSQHPSPPASLVESSYTAECERATLATLSADERCAIEVLQCFSTQRQQGSPLGRPPMPPAQRRSKSDADLKYAAANPSPTLTNLFRREPEVSSSKSTQALQNLVVNLESQLGEAYHEIRVVREERDEMARERDEQRQILYDAERQMDDILHRHHHGPHLKQYMDDLRHLHEMIYSYEASLLEAGIEPSAFRYRSSIEALRSQLHFPIKAPRGHPSHATTPLARSAYTHFVTPPLTPEPRAPTDLPEVVPDLRSAPNLLDAREAWGIPRCASPASLEEVSRPLS